MRKIVYCLIDSSRSGGMERSICAKANYLVDVLGYEVTIITTDRGEKPNFFEFSSKIKFIDLDINYFELESHSLLQGVVLQTQKRKQHRLRLEATLKELKADICISTCTHEFTILPKIADGSRKIAEMHFCRSYKKIEAGLTQASFFKKWRIILGEKNKYRFVNQYDAFVVLTDEDRQQWSGYTNILKIPNLLSIQPKEKNAESKKVISVGRLTLQKGFTYLIEAWTEVHQYHPDWQLVIYGEGEDEVKLKEILNQKELDNSISIHPPVADIEEAYAKSSLFALTSLYEGFGLVFAEAMACGLPCVAFDCQSGPSEIIDNGEDGFLIEVKNTTEFAQKILYLIENESVRHSMGMKAKTNIQRFQPENVMPKWVELFEQILNK